MLQYVPGALGKSLTTRWHLNQIVALGTGRVDVTELKRVVVSRQGSVQELAQLCYELGCYAFVCHSYTETLNYFRQVEAVKHELNEMVHIDWVKMEALSIRARVMTRPSVLQNKEEMMVWVSDMTKNLIPISVKSALNDVKSDASLVWILLMTKLVHSLPVYKETAFMRSWLDQNPSVVLVKTILDLAEAVSMEHSLSLDWKESLFQVVLELSLYPLYQEMFESLEFFKEEWKSLSYLKSSPLPFINGTIKMNAQERESQLMEHILTHSISSLPAKDIPDLISCQVQERWNDHLTSLLLKKDYSTIQNWIPHLQSSQYWQTILVLSHLLDSLESSFQIPVIHECIRLLTSLETTHVEILKRLVVVLAKSSQSPLLIPYLKTISDRRDTVSNTWFSLSSNVMLLYDFSLHLGNAGIQLINPGNLEIFDRLNPPLILQFYELSKGMVLSIVGMNPSLAIHPELLHTHLIDLVCNEPGLDVLVLGMLSGFLARKVGRGSMGPFGLISSCGIFNWNHPSADRVKSILEHSSSLPILDSVQQARLSGFLESLCRKSLGNGNGGVDGVCFWLWLSDLYPTRSEYILNAVSCLSGTFTDIGPTQSWKWSPSLLSNLIEKSLDCHPKLSWTLIQCSSRPSYDKLFKSISTVSPFGHCKIGKSNEVFKVLFELERRGVSAWDSHLLEFLVSLSYSLGFVDLSDSLVEWIRRLSQLKDDRIGSLLAQRSILSLL